MAGERRDRRLLKVASGVLVGTLAIAIVAGVFEFAGAIPAGPRSSFGWAVPLVSLAVIVGVTALLFFREPDDADEIGLYATCDSCGHTVLPEWRLCPYCGARLHESSAEEEHGSPAEEDPRVAY